MKKLLMILAALVLICDISYAAKTNLMKAGTSWVWRVEDGSDGTFILMEDGTSLVTELSSRVIFESSGVSYALLETGDRTVFENGNGVALESSTDLGADTMPYKQLVSQGWEATDSPATIPQAIQGTDAALAYELLALENGSRMLFENTNTLRLEN